MRKERITDWLDIARSDIEASKLLYKEGLFAQSYFYFQQACEKSNKAFWMLNGLVTQDGLRAIGHDQIKPLKSHYQEQMKHIRGISNFEKDGISLTQSPLFSDLDLQGYSKDLAAHIEELGSLKNKDLSKVTTADLDEWSNTIKDLEEAEVSLPDNFLDLIKEKMIANMKLLESFTGDAAENEKKEWLDFIEKTGDEQLMAIFKKVLDDILELSSISVILYTCTILTVQHSSKTRYPESPHWTNPLDFYQPSLTIVERQMEFLEHLNKALARLLTWIEQNSVGDEKKLPVESNILPKKPSSIDEAWQAFGIRNKQDFINEFFISKNMHSGVPKEIVKEMETFELLQQYSMYTYRLYDDAFGRLTRIFEMALKVRIEQLGQFQKGDTLVKIIGKIANSYPKELTPLLDWGRKMRNMGAHPRPGTLMGSMLKLPILRMTNLINDIFREKEFLLGENEKVKLLGTEFEYMKKGLWKCDEYLIQAVELLAYREGYTLWTLKPVSPKFPQSVDEVFHEPFYITLKQYALNGKDMVGVDAKGRTIVLEKTRKKEYIEMLENYRSQFTSSPPNVKDTIKFMLNHNIEYEIQKFKNTYSAL